MAKNRHAVALGRKGGKTRSPAQTLARAKNGHQGGRPPVYRLVMGRDDDILERCVNGRWIELLPPYDAAARAYLRRHAL